ncbi:aryl-alcohol dehydrogenase [Pseudoclavibacter endophyticus]|uniref:NAD(P)-dependent alcohol dehydrogenase n=1 Tax=Pseudoclavibacter endophyticus TaxID=1778590 RepID=A0A6H9WBN6_9MICO|nr:NAD(P)-dependent alcohol dehydrogenase [Pseudoclavibacter endophyticus]KAB1648073.1 NAD(P)-dependent alcohol dehydrogenase [Pseudoclavibacter endophyticus]GGA69473.1 aryl-alcohol dehydrogenase [Pseudoclavibacter endophyticus]
MQITAAVADHTGARIELEQLTLDDPGVGEVRVRLVATGVCHTDKITRDGDLPLPLPGVLGHEGAGVVDAVGEGVTEVAVGDHVVMGWAFCGVCRNCRRGEPKYCEQTGPAVASGVRFKGPNAGESAYRREDGTPISGHFFGQSSFATYSIALASSLIKVDQSAPLELLGPLACGISTGAGAVLNTAKPQPGDTIVVFGAGAVGLAAVMAARSTPAAAIVAVDLHDSRLELATKYGATAVVNGRADDASEQILAACGGRVDYAIECTGAIAVIEQAVSLIGMLGTVILVGGAPAGSSFSVEHQPALWGKRIVGTLGGGSSSAEFIPALIALHAQGRFPFDELVKFYELADIETAIADSLSGEVVKPIVRISQP